VARLAPALQASLASETLAPGGVVVCRVQGLVPVGMTLAGFSQEAGFYFSKTGAEWVALLAVPLAAHPGRRALKVKWDGGVQTLWLNVGPDPYPQGAELLVRGLQRRLERADDSGDNLLLQHRQKGQAPWPLWHGHFQSPLRGEVTVTSPFGERRDYNHGQAGWRHKGVDLRAAKGSEVLASNDGVVVLARKSMALTGGTVVVDHGYGLTSAYFHLSKVEVKAGQTVLKGGLLGSSGNSGLSQGPHLHFELRLHGVPVNPWQWVQADGLEDSSRKTAPGTI
jgi:hypothetical protein